MQARRVPKVSPKISPEIFWRVRMLRAYEAATRGKEKVSLEGVVCSEETLAKVARLARSKTGVSVEAGRRVRWPKR